MIQELANYGRCTPELLGVCFSSMTEAELRQWVEANPGRVNDALDFYSSTLLNAAVACCRPPLDPRDFFPSKSLELILWLLNEKGADARVSLGPSLIFHARSPEVIGVLLDHGADPTLRDHVGQSTLMEYLLSKNEACVARLLSDPRVRAIVNERRKSGT